MVSVLGYCPLCDKLVSIIPKGVKQNGKDRRWYTVDHDSIIGDRCDNKKEVGQ
jgi:hypothetical protein